MAQFHGVSSAVLTNNADKFGLIDALITKEMFYLCGLPCAACI
jgi:hypothetical protein